MANDNMRQRESSLLVWPEWLKFILALSVIFVLIAAGMNSVRGYRYIGKPLDNTNTIAMTGEGKIVAVPDVLKMTFGHTITKATVAEAQKETVDTMNAFTQVLKNKGVEAKDIKTVNYSVYPQYDYTESGQVLRGYTVSQSVEVKLRNFDEAGNIVAVAAEGQLNQVGGLNFTIDDPEKYRQEARIEAIKNAKEKAKNLAKEAGISLGRIRSISESSDGQSPVFPMMRTLDMAESGSAPAPQIEAGSNDIMVTVTLVYEVL